MPNVNLSDAEWQQVMNILGDVPWKIAHPLLMKIGGQLQALQRVDPQAAPPPLMPMSDDEYDRIKRTKPNAGGKEAGHE